MTISIFDFKYHILVGHVLPALPLYLFGLYTFLKHLRIAFYATGPAQGIAKVIVSLVTTLVELTIPIVKKTPILSSFNSDRFDFHNHSMWLR